MSIYAGTIGEREYAHGRDDGRVAAENWRDGGWSTWRSAGEDEGRDDLALAATYRTRSYSLGWLRGFREVSR